MSLGALALVLAVGAAGWLLWRSARPASGGEARNVALLKGIAFLALAAVLFAAKLMPIAFMTLVAAGAVTAIEVWRDRAIKAETGSTSAPSAPKIVLQAEEAASILGVPVDAPPTDIRAAHRKLIGQLHPDKGGTDYLAAKINDARDVLLRRNASAADIS